MPLRRWFSEHGMPSWYSWWVVIGGCLTTLAISLIFTQKAVHDSQRAMCDVVVVQDEAFRQTPPSAPTGKSLAKALHDLRVAYGCPKE